LVIAAGQPARDAPERGPMSAQLDSSSGLVVSAVEQAGAKLGRQYLQIKRPLPLTTVPHE
jgi:hypothetical protein